jgi:hypothetical protein
MFRDRYDGVNTVHRHADARHAVGNAPEIRRA